MGCEELSKKRPWEVRWGGIIFKIVYFVIILISIQNIFLINNVTAYPPAEVCYFKPDQFKLSTSFPEI